MGTSGFQRRAFSAVSEKNLLQKLLVYSFLKTFLTESSTGSIRMPLLHYGTSGLPFSIHHQHDNIVVYKNDQKYTTQLKTAQATALRPSSFHLHFRICLGEMKDCRSGVKGKKKFSLLVWLTTRFVKSTHFTNYSFNGGVLPCICWADSSREPSSVHPPSACGLSLGDTEPSSVPSETENCTGPCWETKRERTAVKIWERTWNTLRNLFNRTRQRCC